MKQRRQLTAFLLFTWFLLMTALTMFGQNHKHDTCRIITVLTSSPEQYEWSCGARTLAHPFSPDTLRVRMLVTYKGAAKQIAFTVDGYEVMDRSQVKTSDGWKIVHSPLASPIYLDDRKRVIKRLQVWQVKAIQ